MPTLECYMICGPCDHCQDYMICDHCGNCEYGRICNNCEKCMVSANCKDCGSCWIYDIRSETHEEMLIRYIEFHKKQKKFIELTK